MHTTAKAATTEKIKIGTGNVFSDLGLPDPDERRLRVHWAAA